jgi:putative hydrolase of HD superfamily
MPISSDNKKIMYLIQQAGTTMLMQRNHVRNLGNSTFDTIASHSFHTAVIAYCITRMEGLSHIYGMRAITVGVLHDLAEARTGDNDFITKNYTTMDEEKAVED